MAADEDSANLGRVYSDAEIRAQEARWRLLQGTLFRSAATDDDASGTSASESGSDCDVDDACLPYGGFSSWEVCLDARCARDRRLRLLRHLKDLLPFLDPCDLRAAGVHGHHFKGDPILHHVATLSLAMCHLRASTTLTVRMLMPLVPDVKGVLRRPPRDMPIYVIEPYFGGISIFLFGCHYCLSGELSPAFWQNFRAGRTPPIRSLFEKTADFNEETLYNPDLAHLFEKPIPLPGGTQRRRPQHRTAVHHHSSRAPQKGRALWVVVSGGSSL